MLIVGEKINTSRKEIREAVARRDAGFIRDLARRQYEAGAGMIDVNCGTFVDDEPEILRWLVQEVQDELDGVPLCIDSPNPDALRAALQVHRGEALVNSISGETGRYQNVLPLLKEFNCRVVVLCMDSEHGIPHDAETRVRIASDLIDRLQQEGIPQDKIYVDPLVQPVSTATSNGPAAVDTIRMVHAMYPAVHSICGLSNISFGLPNRWLLNQAFLVMCMYAGLDGVILDPLDRKMMALLTASLTLTDRDPYCAGYLKAFRQGTLSE